MLSKAKFNNFFFYKKRLTPKINVLKIQETCESLTTLYISSRGNQPIFCTSSMIKLKQHNENLKISVNNENFKKFILSSLDYLLHYLVINYGISTVERSGYFPVHTLTNMVSHAKLIAQHRYRELKKLKEAIQVKIVNILFLIIIACINSGVY